MRYVKRCTIVNEYLGNDAGDNDDVLVDTFAYSKDKKDSNYNYNPKVNLSIDFIKPKEVTNNSPSVINSSSTIDPPSPTIDSPPPIHSPPPIDSESPIDLQNPSQNPIDLQSSSQATSSKSSNTIHH